MENSIIERVNALKREILDTYDVFLQEEPPVGSNTDKYCRFYEFAMSKLSTAYECMKDITRKHRKLEKNYNEDK